MTRYYFHLVDFSGGVIEDEEGSNLPSLAAAKEQALVALQEIVAEAVVARVEAQVETIVIADQRGTHLAAVPLLVAMPSKIVGLLKNPEKVVPENRFEEYRRNADDCRAKAATAPDPDDQRSWLNLADAWLQMLPKSHPATTEVDGWPKASNEDSKASH